MPHLGKPLERFAPNSLGWRIRGNELWIFLFEFLQTAEKTVVLNIGDLRVVEHVIAVIVIGDLLT